MIQQVNLSFRERILTAPVGEADGFCLLHVQVKTIEEVFVGRTTDVDPSIAGPGSEDQQAEEPDGEATPQVTAVRDLTGIQQLVAMVISQRSGIPWVFRMFPVKPNY